MTWYNNTGKEHETVLSSRVRFARNLSEYPFGSRLSSEKADEIINKVAPILENGGFEKIDFTKLSRAEALSYVEKHYVSREFAEKSTPHALMLNEPCGYAVMLCEEDHLRIQVFADGLDAEAEKYCPPDRRKWHCALYDAIASALILIAITELDGFADVNIEWLARYSGFKDAGQMFLF